MLMHFVGVCVLGACLGFIGGLFGIGGGLLAIPILGICFGLHEQVAQGTAMVMVTPNVIVGLQRYARHPDFNKRIALMLALPALPLTYLGVHAATHIDSNLLRRAFACFLFALAAVNSLSFMRMRMRSGQGKSDRSAWPWAGVLGAAGGFISGFFSVGGAVFAVPCLTLLFGLTQRAAQGVGLAMVTLGTLVGLSAYARAHDVNWGIGVPLAIGGILFVSPGAALAHRLPDLSMRALFSLLLVVSACALLLKS